MERDRNSSRIPDGGGRRQGKPAAPEDMLAAPANKLETEPHPQDVTAAVTDIIKAAETIIEAVDTPREYGIRNTDSTAEQLATLAETVESKDISLLSPTQEDHESATQKLQESTRNIRQDKPIEDGTALRLLDDLETVDACSTMALTTTLSTTVEHLDQYRQIRNALVRLSLHEDTKNLGHDVRNQFEDLDVNNASKLVGVGQTLESAAEDLETCHTERDRLRDALAEITERAAEQTSWPVQSEEPDEGASELIEKLEEGELWFADDSTSIVGLATQVKSSGVAQSKPAREFLQVLTDTHSSDTDRVKERLEDAVVAIDKNETVSTRLEGVDSDDLLLTADRLLADLRTHSDPVASQLRDRIENVKRTTIRSNDTDLLTLYAVRQELRYYDRTLIPQLGSPTQDETGAETVARRIETIDNRRMEMRQSYPSEYPDCDHTIPIYFFDLVSNLLETSSNLQNRGELQRAAGLADAAEQILEWIAGMYETHSYFVLLKQLRG